MFLGSTSISQTHFPSFKALPTVRVLISDEILFLNARYDLARVRGTAIRPCPQKPKSFSPGATASSQINGANDAIPNLTPEKMHPREHDQQAGRRKRAPGNAHRPGSLPESMANGDVVLSQN